jgi:pSer/pThr/pTyr-binding forkhead associated (FHA) protein
MTACPICQAENSPAETWCVECGWLLSQIAPGEAVASDERTAEEALGFRAFVILPERGMIPLKKARTVVGREFGDLLLPEDLNVSRIHLALVAENGGLYVEDLRSSNGTLLNGIKIPPGKRYLLSGGDVVSAGDTPLKVEFKGGPEEAKNQAGLYLKDSKGKLFRLRQGENTVGRLPLNTITVEESPFVAREHAVLSLERTPSGLFFLYITDLGSSNGSFINHRPVASHTRIRVHPNDEVTFADATFRVIEIEGEED